MKKTKSKSNSKSDAFVKFERLTKALIAVPKKEAEEQSEREKDKRTAA